MNAVLRHLHKVALLHDGGGLADGQLLDRFLTQRDEDAFTGLVVRHGPMVLAVCRRLLGNAHDAEDAFQATFLVLARKAAALRTHPLLGGWLHGVAYRTSLKARSMRARRRARERPASPRAAVEATGRESDEMLGYLDHELTRLPDKYRLPVVLCELEGRSRKEVAGRLHIPEGTLSSRLAYAKKLLAKRLARYGAGALAALLSRDALAACVPSPLLQATAQAALRTVAGESLRAGAISAQVVTLTEGVLKAMLVSKLKTVWGVALVVLVGAGAVGLTYRTAWAQGRGGGGSSATRVTVDDLEELRLEVAALRKGLQATKDRVRTLEAEVATLQERRGPRGGGGSGGFSLMGGGIAGLQGGLGGLQGGLGGLQGGLGGLQGGLGGGGGITGAGSRSAPTKDPFRGSGNLGPQGSISGEAAGGPTATRSQSRQKTAEDPLTEAEAALKKLRTDPSDQKAREAVDRALRWLREREKLRDSRNNAGTSGQSQGR
jgi:RNA polymerase sigma factor (sigma-70 family)